MTDTAPVSVVIPTYRREQVLLESLQYLQEQQPRAAEILVLDQTERHEPQTDHALRALADCGAIRWVKLAVPSIPAAMNRGLALATQEVVLFLDDDIRPEPGLFAAHVSAHAQHPGTLVAGRVIQPWQEGVEGRSGEPFDFCSTQPRWIDEFMGGNFSVRREHALTLGGFDENFVRVAYRFEAEFAHRHRAAGGRIRFEPGACLHHLKSLAGGTRTFGEHLTTWRPDHAVGDYYFGLRTGAWRQFIVRPVRSVATRYHARHPWRIPGTLLAELGGMFWALALYLRGPRHVQRPSRNVSP
jgi:GT2 family glycosyltransferase